MNGYDVNAMRSDDKPRFYFGGGSGFIQGIVKQRYQTGTLAISCRIAYFEGDMLEDVEDDAVSVNLAHGQVLQSKDLKDGEFFANVNSREQLYNALVSCGWIEGTGQRGFSGHCEYPVCRLTDKAVILEDRA